MEADWLASALSVSNLYTRLAATALKLIRDKGTSSAILSRRGDDAVFDPTTGTFTSGGTLLTGTIDCAVVPHSSGLIRALASGQVNADNAYVEDFIKGKLRKLIIAASSAPFAPESGDEVSNLDGSVWEVIGATPLAPDGLTAVLYTASIRKK